MNLRDPERFAAVYAEFAPAAASAAAAVLAPAGRRGDVEDVVHDVFARLWRHPEQFDPARGPFGAYVRLVARSRALDLYRSGTAAVRATDRIAATVERAPAVDSVAETVEHRVARAAVLRAMAGLPQAQRDAIALACWGDLSARQIADRSGVPLGTIKGRIRLGLARMRAELEANEVTAASIVGTIASLL